MSTLISRPALVRTALPCGLAALLGACALESGEPEGERIECALDGADFASDCILELLGDAGTRFAIHGPDGGFRRFSVDPQNGTITLVDGAEDLSVREEPDGAVAELAVGSDRYRIERAMLGPKAE